jgi:putative transcriptional regulator
MDISNLTGQFLIAVPSLLDPNFARTVVLLCRHDADGAMGLVVNRHSGIGMDRVLRGIGLDGRGWEGEPVHYGGPVEPERGFVLHTRNPIRASASSAVFESSLKVTDEIVLTISQDVIRRIAGGRGPEKALVALGYAGWAPGQLEAEIVSDGWLIAPPDPIVIFDVPIGKRWDTAVRNLGIDPARLVASRGNA